MSWNKRCEDGRCPITYEHVYGWRGCTGYDPDRFPSPRYFRSEGQCLDCTWSWADEKEYRHRTEETARRHLMHEPTHRVEVRDVYMVRGDEA